MKPHQMSDQSFKNLSFQFHQHYLGTSVTLIHFPLCEQGRSAYSPIMDAS